MKKLLLAGLVLSLSMLVACDNGPDENEVGAPEIKMETQTEEHSHADDAAHTHGNAIDDATAEDYNIKTPGDLPDELQAQMLKSLADYNGCMQENRPEFYVENLDAEKAAGVVMETCEPHLASIEKMLNENGVLKAFTIGMLKKRRNKSARKLMGNVMNVKVAMEIQREKEAAGVTH